MKASFFIFIAVTLLMHHAFAGANVKSNALDKKYSFCDDTAKIDQLLDRSREDVERIQAEKLKIERIVVSKQHRELYLVSGETLLRTYKVAFGREYKGPKQFEGDRKTPEGLYSIDYKNPQSAYTKSLHISYPNKKDLEYAKSQGRSAGGAIMIHGFPNDLDLRAGIEMSHPRNWTLGCIAVTSDEIEEIYTLVKENTLIEICSVQPPEPMPTPEPSPSETDVINEAGDAL